MLMHVDRLPTHIISAILQVGTKIIFYENFFVRKKITLILYFDI